MFSLKGKTAIVTGSQGGIGQAIIGGLAKAGASPYGMDMTCGGDITNYKNMKKQFAWINKEEGSIDILVNCAGITFRNRISETFSLKEWNKTLEVNLTAPFKLSQLVFPFMKEKGGSIINITSIWCNVVLKNNPAYGASKGGLKVMSKALALDWAKYQIRVNCIGLGFFKTDMTKGTWTHKGDLNKRLKRIPLGRIGEPEDAVGAAIFLASEASKYVTGIDLYVSGGWEINGS